MIGLHHLRRRHRNRRRVRPTFTEAAPALCRTHCLGRRWIWNLAAEHFADATEILETCYRSSMFQTLPRCCALQAKAWTEASIQLLDEANRMRPKSEFVKDESERQRHFQTNTERSTSASVIQGLFVLSWDAKPFGRRLKQSGMRLDRPRCQCQHRPQMLRTQPSLGAVLGGPLG